MSKDKLVDADLIAQLQGNIPLEARPFARIADAIGWSEGEVLSRLRRWQAEGRLRRVGAVLAHRRAGVAANALVLWQVPSGRLEEVGEALARDRRVTHCYQRKPAPGWPYNLFFMVHGQRRSQVEAVVKELADELKVRDYRILFSTVEIKKTSMTYA
ncbi:MAG: Lrp/AsnC family transcriptional regulator [Clostridia bacterium]|nr:Lrp/AsnC family transcriptional regulator [Clostridia bacterium]